MNKLIQVIDKEYVKELEKFGFIAIARNDVFTLMACSNDKFNYNELDSKKILFTNKMTF